MAFLCASLHLFAQIAPETDKITLTSGGGSSRPVQVTDPQLLERTIGERRLDVKERAVTAFSKADGTLLWSARSSDNYMLNWMAAEANIAFFSGTPPEKTHGPDRLFRLDLRSGKWLSPLPIQHAVLSVLTGPDYVCVLTIHVVHDKVQDEDKMAAYQVLCFRNQETTPLWTREFPTEPEDHYHGAMLLAARQPTRAPSAIQSLSWFRDQLLVCAGPRQHLVGLDKKSGRTSFQIERIWEYQRGFIGPSVWSHFISRYGQQRFLFRSASSKPTLAKMRAAFEAQHRCAVIAGPIVVPCTGAGSSPTSPHIFVAVSNAPADGYSAYLADCIVYELNEFAQMIGMVHLPRLINGAEVEVRSNELIWGCENGGMVKLAASDGMGGVGPGSSDRLIRVAWYQQYAPYAPTAWLRSDSAGQWSAFTPGTAYRIHAGGFILERETQVYQFPISKIDTETGHEEILLLKVPFNGVLPLPHTNVSDLTTGGHTYLKTHGPYVLAITHLDMEGSILRITLGTETWSKTVSFEMANLHH